MKTQNPTFVLIGIAALLGVSVDTARAQPPTPRPPTNLQVLDKGMSRRDVVAVMRGFAQGLGVRCQHCHVYTGENPDDLSTFEFASDQKATKGTARSMMKMVAAINGDLLKGVGEAAPAGESKVTCYTCHRGDKRPLTSRPPPLPATPAPSATPTPATPAPEPVVFVCEHGTVKSVMAMLLFNQMAAERGLQIRAVSRGVLPDPAVPEAIVDKLSADGLTLGDFTSKALDKADVASASRVVAIGVDVKALTSPGAVPVETWNDIPAASSDYAAARDALKVRIDRLLGTLADARPEARARRRPRV